MRELKINANDAGQRLDKFLTKALPSMPKSLMYKAIRTKKIKVAEFSGNFKISIRFYGHLERNFS